MVVGDIETGTELAIIGSGPGGYSAALRAAQEGIDVTLIEKDEIGGVCLNRGCIPAKSLIHAAGFQKDIENWEEIGIETEDIEPDLQDIQDWKNGIVDRLNSGIKMMLEKQGVNVVQGTARFLDSNTLRVEEDHNAENIEFENCIIATGSKPIEIPGFEFSNDRILSSRELLNLEEVPEELVVIGGGYIGMEAVTKFSSFGSKVKVVEVEENILSNFDQDIVKTLKDSNSCYSDEIYTSTEAESFRTEEGKVVVEADRDGEKVDIEGDYVLVSVGRTCKPYFENLSLENTNVKTDNGRIQVDSQRRTSENHIFAIGDVTTGPMLAHKAYREGKVVADVVAGKSAAFDSQYIPKVVYTDPEIAVAGMTPEQAKDKTQDVKIGKFKFSSSGRALSTNQEAGFARVVARDDGKLLGVQIVGPRASDMIAEATLALEMQAYLDDIINTIHAHPTFPEVFQEACEDAKGKSVHKP